MKKIEFSIEGDGIELIPIADAHIGSEQFDESLFKEVCDYIANSPKTYCILNGDIVNNSVNGPGSVFDDTLSPQSQVALACKYLAPIAEKKKIINMCVGNHELRSNKEVGLSPADLILAHLMGYDESLNERYSLDSCYTFLTLKPKKRGETRVCFTIFNLHGTGGGSKIGAKIAKLDDMAFLPANVYIRSHTHIPETHKGVNYEVNTNNHTIKEVESLFVNTNSYLKRGGYGDRAGMKSLSRAIPVITLKAQRVCYRKDGKQYETYVKKINCALKESVYD